MDVELYKEISIPQGAYSKNRCKGNQFMYHIIHFLIHDNVIIALKEESIKLL